MQGQWSDWIEHDGTGCPVMGQKVQITRRNGAFDEIPAACTQNLKRSGEVVNYWPPRIIDKKRNSWIWYRPRNEWQTSQEIVRYRVWRSVGLQMIESALEVKTPTAA